MHERMRFPPESSRTLAYSLDPSPINSLDLGGPVCSFVNRLAMLTGLAMMWELNI